MRIEDTFKWFTGVVEDRNDPEKLNRVRVRIFGAHTQDKNNIATADLPWATVMMPTTSSSNSGLGLTLHGLVEGSWVVGFWKDGASKQDPMIMGSFVGQNALKTHVIKNIDGKEADVTNIAGLSFSSDSQRSLRGFIDPRIPAVADYGKGDEATPEGINPPHNPTRSTGLTLDLDHSPKKDNIVIAYNYPRPYYVANSDVNQLSRGWAGKPEASTDSANPYKLMTDDEAKLELIDPDTNTQAFTKDENGNVTFVRYKDKIAAEGSLLLKLGQVAEEEIKEATAAWKKIQTDYNIIITSEANSAASTYADAYDYIYPNDIIESGGVGKTLFKGPAITAKTTVGEAILTGLEADTSLNKGDNEDRKSWVKPKYPFNHVYESESGHVIEIDDTPGYERINLFHRKGARVEINNEGEIHMIAAPGQDLNLQAANVNIQNTGSGNFNVNCDAELNLNATNACKITSKGPTDIISSGITKIFSMLDTKIASIGKNIIG